MILWAVLCFYVFYLIIIFYFAFYEFNLNQKIINCVLSCTEKCSRTYSKYVAGCCSECQETSGIAYDAVEWGLSNDM
jgi:hypothetical protein